ncbi:MAG: DUF59 domain-containing protein [candidate division NC10 bacterium]|nr:DUF59 domain-containing protein [candidate division NC10 bacterium]
MLSQTRVREILQGIEDPESGLSLHDLGLVRSVDYERETGRLIIALDYRRRTPSCFACKPLAWMLQRKIAEALREAFSQCEGVREVEIAYR